MRIISKGIEKVKCMFKGHSIYYLHLDSFKDLVEGSCMCGENKYRANYSEFVAFMKKHKVIENQPNIEGLSLIKK